ncbi:4Fe-4S dicluster domain-containing protein [Halodesulfovibrio marinisediminis]|uniref:4Fe-4S dicluster domain-containing protein n=1 Tax=Halodesulfovibrio marinisediminis DSM 17456 TaxID=1121457 RepID=A0A1N6DHW3_9BACT|nr:4Fe-4S dicluster domain-containing protein [Halodesulfovibrio marinisediminis]SIN70348.1 4Fe-4S dicluster domain-containing protein [Halodesulfovibrio marinisediminis DSM 17456]
MACKFITHENINSWLEALAKDHVVFVPVDDNGTVTYRPYGEDRKPVLDRIPVRSPKEAVFPQNETLLTYKYDKNPEDLERTSVRIKETLPKERAVVFGARPCGARGMTVFDSVFVNDRIRDPYYATRRENTLVVTIACNAVESTCFCHEVGSDPADKAGSDILLTPVEGGFAAEAVTERGGKMLEESFFADGGDKCAEAEAVQKATREMLGEAHDFSNAPEALLAVFDDDEFWEEQAAGCLSCGACTYLCPTCYCFNITDEPTGTTGKRLRTWDTCMSFQYTLEGSGHNPRTTKAKRLKNRVNHKFAYYPNTYDKRFGCCGCGRCIKSCPASIDIRSIVKAAQARSAKKESK